MENAPITNSSSKQTRAMITFLSILILYFALIIFLIFYFYYRSDAPKNAFKIWWAGLIIGGIYVCISLYYFYEHLLSPYVKESRTIEGKEIFSRKGSIITIISPNIYSWMIQWIVPALLIQVFVIFGFFLTIQKSQDKPVLTGSTYSSSAIQGSIYRRLQSISNTPATSFNDEKIEEMFKRARFIETEFSGYFDNTNFYNGEGKERYITKITKDLEVPINTIPYKIAITFGFLGTLIYTLTNIVSRLNSHDLYPYALINYLVRFIFAPTICVVLAYLVMDNFPVFLTPVIFFFIGYFPQRALQYIEEKARDVLSLPKEETGQAIPLSMIQGMTDYIIYRFKEIGISDAQTLAYSDLPTLKNNLGYSDRQICDFVAQALLLIYLKDDFGKLQLFGIRTIINFKDTINMENYKNIAQILGIAPEKLAGMLKLISAEGMDNRIQTLKSLIRAYDQREKERRTLVFGTSSS